jgi:putative ABC transport system substrate-binding protein
MVFSGVSDPVEQGFVASLARPGGNITGTTLFEFSLAPKLLEALNEIVPGLTRVTLLYNPDVRSTAGYVRSIETAARSMGIETIATTVVNETEMEPAIEKSAGEASSGLIVLPGQLFPVHRRLIVGLTARHHLPTIYMSRVFVDAGGLMSYGARRDEHGEDCGQLCQSDTPRRESRRSSGGATHQVRVRDQSQGRQGARP